TLRDSSVKPDRVKEMEIELVSMNKNVDALKEIVKDQTANAERRAQQQPQQIENLPAIGLGGLGSDEFSSITVSSAPEPPSTKVGPYIVSDFGSLFSTVTTPEGQTYRCATVIFPEVGAGIQCKKS